MTLTARSYCTGYTGLEMAVRAAFGGFEVLSHSDIKPASARLLEHYYPHIPNLGDMRAVDYSDLVPADLMIGSWPCQPHSAAGKRLGEADPRDLWPEYERAIDATRPALFFGENVGRITGNGELRRVATSLAQRGYVGAWRVQRASDVGACHRRERCFVLAVDPAAYAGGEAGRLTGHAQSGDSASTAGVRSSEPGRRDHGTGVELLPTPIQRNVRGADRRGPRNDGGGCGFDLQTAITLLPTPAAQNTKGPARRGARLDGYARSERQTNLPGAIELLPTPKATDGPKGGPGMRGSSGDLALPSAVQVVNFGRYAAAIRRHEIALGRPAPEPTQISERNGKPQLSARFVEWMMMLPEGWVTDVPDLVDSPRRSVRNAQLSLLGDGVVPAQGAPAFRFLLEHLSERLAAECAA